MTAMQKRLYHGRTLTCQRCAKPFTITEQTPDPVPAASAPARVSPAEPEESVESAVAKPAPEPAASQALAVQKSGKGISAGRMALLLGVVAVVVTLLLYFTIAPSVHRKRETGRRIACSSNLTQIFTALQLHAASNNGRFPDSLSAIVANGSLPPELLICPSSRDTTAPGTTPSEQVASLASGGNHNSYIYVGKGMTERVSTRAIVYEVLEHHDGEGVNVLYTDGTVKFLPRAAALVALPQLGGAQTPTTSATTQPAAPVP
jgi:hypothetical protein